ncbi:unnamed protein product [Moneuplotes crassus]|uniref:Uncharacterized protein n=1 Tax=Euplotes crassus TaxID=5936 RepID=A0AAD1Y228_EUPCR|nr:unnamed protein product [Moneuplotes crassus]
MPYMMFVGQKNSKVTDNQIRSRSGTFSTSSMYHRLFALKAQMASRSKAFFVGRKD